MNFARSTRRLIVMGAAACMAAALPSTSPAAVRVDASIHAENAARDSRVDINVWTNKEEGGVYRQGEPMRVSFRSSVDAFVLIYNIDTEGYIHLVYPYGPEDPDRVEGGVTYQVPSRGDPYDLVADGPTGIEYVVAIASPYPFRDLPWYLTGGYEGSQRGDYGDDEDDSGVIVGDPYVGMDRVVRRVVPPGGEEDVATDDTYFYIERRVEYPRYVCADCHSYGGSWDPYGDICSVVDIRIDAGWARFRPLRSRILRPRYFYMVRSTAPTRYRQWKDRWSSIDGRRTLRTRFQVDGQDKFRSRRDVIQRRTPPEFRDRRRPTSGRAWRAPDEVIRQRDRDSRSRERGEARERSDVRERSRPEQPDRSTWQRQREMRNRDDARQREERDRRREDQRQQQRQMQERRQQEQRQWRERRQEQPQEQRPQTRERRDERRRDEARREQGRREEARREESKREESRREVNRREERVREQENRSEDKGRAREERRRDDGDRDNGRGRGRDRGR